MIEYVCEVGNELNQTISDAVKFTWRNWLIPKPTRMLVQLNLTTFAERK